MKKLIFTLLTCLNLVFAVNNSETDNDYVFKQRNMRVL